MDARDVIEDVRHGRAAEKPEKILYHKAEVPGTQSEASRLRGGGRSPWSLGSLDVKTAFLYAELNEEEDGIVIVQPPA
eukprot:7428318-Lingulodinium_polyedra.AAC.1